MIPGSFENRTTGTVQADENGMKNYMTGKYLTHAFGMTRFSILNVFHAVFMAEAIQNDLVSDRAHDLGAQFFRKFFRNAFRVVFRIV